ncbi:hypothetical protein SO802_012159 [Lithocarpus litseifolius]|uniref:Uncharacterized protein n=1 Tax=Lithocarpus litseifolius TaxID=425828 RepID=A0AAW2D4I4_9ROSI
MASTTPQDTAHSSHTTHSTTPLDTAQPSHTTHSTTVHLSPAQSPLLLLSYMSNLMSIKLDYTNYNPWKHQLTTIQKAYSLIKHIDEQRFTSTSRANILNLKLELQSLKKGNDYVYNFLQKIKVARDKLLIMGVIVDNEELLCIVLGGLPRDFAHFCFTIRTRSDPISYEQLAIMPQSKEQAMTDHLDLIHHSLAMFSSNSKPNSSSRNQSQSHSSSRGRGRNNSNRGRGGGRYNNNGG